MLLTDYFRSTPDAAWQVDKECGVSYGVIRLPEDPDFDITSGAHWDAVHKRFTDFGVKPVIIEPMPNELHDHIKIGDGERDRCIEKAIGMLPQMERLGISAICFNWMAHIGWLRTRSDYPERGGAKVTAFQMADFTPTDGKITHEQLWENYQYFLDAILPHAEKHGIKLLLHPDDPPVPYLGDVGRIMINNENIHKAIFDIHPSESLGLTLCQATFHIMGEDLFQIAREYKDKIGFIHFRNTARIPGGFRETYHDNGDLPMAKLMKHYMDLGIDVPVRVDHVPTMVNENSQLAGYDALGRYYAIGYLKGIIEACEENHYAV